MSREYTRDLEAIAVIGMACMFPQAPDLKTFWRNILGAVDAVDEPLPEWEAHRYVESERIHSPRGGYLKGLYRFDPRQFGIMPNSLDGGEPDQFLALHVASAALQDAGYLGPDHDHRDTGIVLGHSTYLHRGQVNLIQHHIVLDQTMELLQSVFPSLDIARLSAVREYLKTKLPQFNADIVPGLVPNVMTGRIANRLDLQGPNYLVDGACASSLLAVSAAMDELRNGRSRMMLAGGVNASLPAEVSVIFTQLGALSKRGRVRPFEAGSDGTLLGEGLGVIVLKRVSDAVADGDRVYAVIRGVGQASDGQGHGLLAPSIEGEALAIERAYAACGVDPATIGLVEAHGTGIPLGDQTEISALKKILGERKGLQGSVAIGSVKSMISHCIPAAGIAGLIKTAMALHHKILPPTLCEAINPELGIETTPLYVNTATRPWISSPGIPRRAGINAFGFGGINAHAILEEAPVEACRPANFAAWPAELCVFSAKDDGALVAQLGRVADFLSNNPGCFLGDIAATLAAQDTGGPHRLAMVVKDGEDLTKKIKQAVMRLQDSPDIRWSTRNGIHYSRSPMVGRLAFMFPGEGSQYLHMFSDLAMCFDEVRNWFDFWRGLYGAAPGEARTDILFPAQSELTEERRTALEKRLHDMDVGSEAVFVAGQAMHGLLTSLGVQPDVMVGHSTGESSALAASGAMTYGDTGQLADFVRELNRVYQCVLEAGKIPTGALLTVGALSQATIEEHIARLNQEVVIAMDNCPNQLVLYGSEDAIRALQKSLTAAGGISTPLPFDRGYHTPHFSAVSEAFGHYYDYIRLKAPRVPLYSCTSADIFPNAIAAVRKMAAGQWSSKVRFRETILKMYQDGVRYFVEVGPSGNLSAFVNDILAGQEHLSLTTDQRRKNSVEQVLTVLAHLYANRREFRLEKLFSSRSVAIIDMDVDIQRKLTGIPLANTMPVLHITDADRPVLLEMLGAPEAPYSGSRPLDGSGASQPHLQPVDAPHEFGPNDHQVMADYFSLMRKFLDQQTSIMEQWAGLEPVAGKKHDSSDRSLPFLSLITEMDEHHLYAECRLCVDEDNFLKDHVLSGPVSEYDSGLRGLSCVPLMVSLEIMAEACAMLSGNTGFRVIENVKAFDWIALDDGELTLNVRAELADIGRKIYRARIFNAGKAVVSADFSFDADWRASALPELRDKKDSRWQGSELYTIGMFHGPTFQSIRRIDGWNDQGIDARLSEASLEGFFKIGETPNFVLNPVLLDALGQLSAYWIALQVGTDFNCFPTTIERIELYRQGLQDLPGLTLRGRQQPVDPARSDMEAPRGWQFECIDNEGQPLLRVTNLVNVYFPVPHRFYEFRRDPLNGWLGHHRKTNGNKDAMLWELTHLPEDFCMQSSGIFLRILATALLSFHERTQWRKLTTNIRHKCEWLFGRACIKEAVRYWIFTQTGRLPYPADIIVSHNGQGTPYVDGVWANNLLQPPEVSLSHDRQGSLVAVTPPQHPVGVDGEHVGRIQHPDLMVNSLATSERLLLQGLDGNALQDRILRIWCAKEAAAKYLGLGLQGRPDKFEVSFQADNWDRAHVNYAKNMIEVDVHRENDSIVALATRHFNLIDKE
ncbi:MAG: beta-ketoacyl synthase N-terminal-like domain-containing protein [Syntrophales bacterium]